MRLKEPEEKERRGGGKSKKRGEGKSREEKDVTKMITYLCPLQAPPSPHLELAGSSDSEKLQIRKSDRKLRRELQERSQSHLSGTRTSKGRQMCNEHHGLDGLKFGAT
jgi:hypothetical protein